MRESVGKLIARAVNSSHLEWWEFKTGDVDRLTALGFASKLSPIGAEMYRLLIAKDHTAHGRCINLLAEKLIPPESHSHFKLPFSWRTAVAKQVVLEFLHPHCRVCNGAGEQIAGNGVLVTCPTCRGYRHHRYSDEERAGNIGVGMEVYRPKFENRVKMANWLVTSEIVSINNALKNSLL